MAEAAGNEVLSDLYRAFALSLREALAALWDVVDGNPSETAEMHVRLADAIAARDADSAVVATKSLLDRHDTALARVKANQASNLME